MMAFIFRRKRFKFLVTLDVEELSLTPLVNGILFAKVRLISGGTFEETTTREEIHNNRVQWNKKCQFECRIYANSSTGELESCICRVSVRKEAKGGKAYQKLGFVDINLSEHAGAHSSRRYLLEGYTTKSRLDNSLLQITVTMKLLSGDPVFKVPKAKSSVEFLTPHGHEIDLQPENKGAVSGSEGSVASGSSGFGSLTRQKQQQQQSASDSQEPKNPSLHRGESSETQRVTVSMVTGHNHQRNSSATSAGYHSLGGLGHSHPDNSEGVNKHNIHKRSRSVDVSECNKISSLSAHRDKGSGEPSGSIEQRLGSTRIDADQVIESLLQGTDFQETEPSQEDQGLALYVGTDGSTAFTTQPLHGHSGKYEKVIMDAR